MPTVILWSFTYKILPKESWRIEDSFSLAAKLEKNLVGESLVIGNRKIFILTEFFSFFLFKIGRKKEKIVLQGMLEVHFANKVKYFLFNYFIFPIHVGFFPHFYLNKFQIEKYVVSENILLIKMLAKIIPNFSTSLDSGY